MALLDYKMCVCVCVSLVENEELAQRTTLVRIRDYKLYRCMDAESDIMAILAVMLPVGHTHTYPLHRLNDGFCAAISRSLCLLVLHVKMSLASELCSATATTTMAKLIPSIISH